MINSSDDHTEIQFSSDPYQLTDIEEELADYPPERPEENEVTEEEMVSEEIFFEVIDNEDQGELIAVDDDSISYWDGFINISKQAIPRACSYTFSIEVLIIMLLLNMYSQDDDNVASSTLIGIILNVAIILGISPLFAMGIIVSRYMGDLKEAVRRGEDQVVQDLKRDRTANVYRNAVLFIAPVMAIPTVGVLFFSESILVNIFGQDKAVAQLTQNFLRAYSPAVIAQLEFRVPSEQIMFCGGKAVPVMLMGGANLLMCTALAVLLEFGGLGIPALGPAGVAYAYVIENYLNAACFALYIGLHKDFRPFHYFNFLRSMRGNLEEFKQFISLGATISFSVAVSSAVSFVNSILAGLISVNDQAAWAFVGLYGGAVVIPSVALGGVAAQEVSRALGEKKYTRASWIGKYSVLTTLVYTVPIPVIVSVAPKILMVILNNNQADIYKTLRTLVPIYSVGVIGDSILFNFLQQLRALGKARSATTIYVTGLSAGMLASILLGLETKLGVDGVALGYAGGSVLAGTGLGLRLLDAIQPSKIKESQEAMQVSSPQPTPWGCASFHFFKNCIPRRRERVLVVSESEEERIPITSVNSSQRVSTTFS